MNRETQAPVIGVTGYAQVGKTSVLQTIRREIGGEQVSFATPLRQILLDIDPYLRVTYTGSGGARFMRYSELLHARGYEWCKENTNLRKYMVGLGAGARNRIDPDVWVTAGRNNIKANGAKQIISLVPDVRYLNEAKLVLEESNGTIIRVYREGVGPANNEEAKQQQLVDDYLYYMEGEERHHGLSIVSISNNGTLADLQNKVLAMLDVLSWWA